jgi:hypothetical protein
MLQNNGGGRAGQWRLKKFADDHRRRRLWQMMEEDKIIDGGIGDCRDERRK